MTLQEAIQIRHAVRRYTDAPLDDAVLAELRAEIAHCNAESGLRIQLATDEPETFAKGMAHYGNFRNVRNYLMMAGPKGPDLDERIGWYGERLALKAVTLGLGTCWVALSFRKGKCRCDLNPDEALRCVIALGYGQDLGVPHKAKDLEARCRVDGAMPDWFRAGMEAAMLAPTAIHQQKFFFTLREKNIVLAENTRLARALYSDIDLGIAKYHFEIGAGRENFKWAEDVRTDERKHEEAD